MLNLKAQLKFYLNKNQISAAELSRRSGVAKSVISDWSAGAVPKNPIHLRQVAKVFGVSIDHLCFGDEETEMFSRWRTDLIEVRWRRAKRRP